MDRKRFFTHGIYAGVLALVLLTGCAGVPKQTTLMGQAERVDISAREMRIRLYDYQSHFASVVEQAADEIDARSYDPAIRHNTLLWKANAIPTMQEAAFQPDPLGAYLDAWIFTAQMAQFFTDGVGQDLFGPWQHIALTASQKLLSDVEATALAIAGDISRPQEIVAGYIGDNPLDDLLFTRESSVAFWAAAAGSDVQGGLSAVGNIDQSFSDLLDRLRIYGKGLPKQSRWQAQLVLADFLAENDIQAFLAEVDTIRIDVNRVADDFDLLLAMVAGMYAASLDSMQIASTHFMSEMDNQRIAISDHLRTERIATLAALHQEREVAMTDMESFTERTLVTAALHMEDTIDHFMWRLAQLAGGFLVVGLFIGAAIATWLNRRKHGNSTTPALG